MPPGRICHADRWWLPLALLALATGCGMVGNLNVAHRRVHDRCLHCRLNCREFPNDDDIVVFAETKTGLQ